MICRSFRGYGANVGGGTVFFNEAPRGLELEKRNGQIKFLSLQIAKGFSL